MTILRSTLCIIVLLAGASPATAQRIRGAAIAADGAPVPDVLVEIRSTTGAALTPLHTDSAGRFELMLPAAGRYELRASRLGYAVIGPTELVAERDRELEIVLRMSTEALALNPVEVTVRRAARTQLDEVRNRIDWLRRIGIGHTLTREEIEQRAAPTLPALIGSMSPRVRTLNTVTGREAILMASPGATTSGVCTPSIYVDGMLETDFVEFNLILPQHLEAVEVYTGGALAPPQYRAGTACGVVLFWTRRDADVGAPALTWKRVALAGAIAAFILLSGVP
jgi:hypothetical protein